MWLLHTASEWRGSLTIRQTSLTIMVSVAFTVYVSIGITFTFLLAWFIKHNQEVFVFSSDSLYSEYPDLSQGRNVPGMLRKDWSQEKFKTDITHEFHITTDFRLFHVRNALKHLKYNAFKGHLNTTDIVKAIRMHKSSSQHMDGVICAMFHLPLSVWSHDVIQN